MQNVVTGNGMPARCYRCEKPATTFVNISSGAVRAGQLSEFRAVCREHNVFNISDGVMVPRETWTAQQDEIKRLRDALRANAVHRTRAVNGKHQRLRMACSQCFTTWPAVESEQHKPGCLAAIKVPIIETGLEPVVICERCHELQCTCFLGGLL